MALNSIIEDAIKEHLKEFVIWMADGWAMSDKDVEASIIKDLPDDPAKAYQMGHNAACSELESAYECFCDED